MLNNNLAYYNLTKSQWTGIYCIVDYSETKISHEKFFLKKKLKVAGIKFHNKAENEFSREYKVAKVARFHTHKFLATFSSHDLSFV